MPGLIRHFLLRITSEKQGRFEGTVFAAANFALGVFSLVRASKDFNQCSSINGLREFSVIFASFSIVLAIIRVVMIVEKRKKKLDDFSKRGKIAFSLVGLVLVGLACWGSSMTFGRSPPPKTESDAVSCDQLFRVTKTQCIITWIMFGLVILRLLRKLGILFPDENDEENEGKAEDTPETEEKTNDAEKNVADDNVDTEDKT